MMEHIRNFDWCENSHTEFVTEHDLDNCVTERILRNTFHDPFISSDSEDESIRPFKIDWNKVFKHRNFDNPNHIFIPCRRPLPPYPKLSSLTMKQHHQCLKVISVQYPNVLPGMFIKKPTETDYNIYENLKDQLTKEQTEYIEWAKCLWSQHCIRALQPKSEIEMVYEAEFKMKAHSMQSFPKKYYIAAQIVLEGKHNNFQLIHKQDLIQVDVQELPQIEIPNFSSIFTVIKQISTPKPCLKHPCQFTLPGEKEMTILPLTEVHRELAQYAADNGVQYIASEGALKCIVELNQSWTIPVSVCQAIGLDGETTNVIVLSSEFRNEKPTARVRTYQAFRNLLQQAFVTQLGNAKRCSRQQSLNESNDTSDPVMEVDKEEDSSDEEALFIAEDDVQKDVIKTPDDKHFDNTLEKKIINHSMENETDFYECTCKDSPFSQAPPRSFRKWQVKNHNNGDHYDLIVHCAHKARNKNEEIYLEPIPEYQIELGGSLQSPDKIKSLALSLYLRKNPTLLNVRIDTSGEVCTVERSPWEQWLSSRAARGALEGAAGALEGAPSRLEGAPSRLEGAPSRLEGAPSRLEGAPSRLEGAPSRLEGAPSRLEGAPSRLEGAPSRLEGAPSRLEGAPSRLHAALDQLQGLLPGTYLLHHQVKHGANALLYTSRGGHGAPDLTLAFDTETANPDEAAHATAAPTLTPVLLPYHKVRNILPCTFTPYTNQVRTEVKKPSPKEVQKPEKFQRSRAGRKRNKPAPNIIIN